MYTEIINPRFNETDAFGHINNNVYTVWFDSCRLSVLKPLLPSLEPKNMNLILAHTSTDFLREVFFGKEVVIKTALEKVGNSSMYFTHGLYQDGELCTEGKAVMIHFNHQSKKSIPIPEDIKKQLENNLFTSTWPRTLNI